MEIQYFQHYDKLSKYAAYAVIEKVKQKPNLLLCTATGNSPLGLYEELVRISTSEKSLFKEIRLIKLDEWGGIPMHDTTACEQYLQRNLIKPLQIPKQRYISFDSNPHSPEEECQRIQTKLDLEGPIDLCILGLGKNGHLGFNEPGPFLKMHCHTAQLKEETLKHSMISSKTDKPGFGLTLGMHDILSSKKIFLIISGSQKEEAKKMFFSRQISTQCPASFLWLHEDVECLVLDNK